MVITITALDHLVINVSDVEASAGWYQRVLGMVREDSVAEPGKPRRTSVKFGAQKMNLRPVTASTKEWFTADHLQAGSNDLCFLTESDPNEVIAHLRECQVEVLLGPVEKAGARGRLTSVYCRDPDGNLIEISSYRIAS